jgi:hypothetical protein
MSKRTQFLFAALLIVIAPKLRAQTVMQSQVALPRPTVAQMVAVKRTTKGTSYPRPTASQRAPDRSKLVVVVGPNGERRFARPAKPTK